MLQHPMVRKGVVSFGGNNQVVQQRNFKILPASFTFFVMSRSGTGWVQACRKDGCAA